MKNRVVITLLVLLILPLLAADFGPSPENQVFQWAVSGESDPWPDGSQSKATL